jgi:TPR repeat protein
MVKEKQGLLTDAFQAYLRAGQKGNTRGRTNAANFLLHGRGIAPDKLQAAKLFEESANEGHARAMLSLGVMYEKGDGVPANPVTAKTWYQRAHIKASTDVQQARIAQQAQAGIQRLANV